MRKPMMSGWCGSESPGSHERCPGYNRANPAKEFQPCPCPCHYGEMYECQCGGIIREAPLWSNEIEPDEMTYVHINLHDGRATQMECE